MLKLTSTQAAALLAALTISATFAAVGLQYRTSSASAEPARLGRYVALGDSYTAGMGIPPRTTAWTPSECQQSEVSYPHLVAADVGFESFADAACSGATTQHFTSPHEVDPENVNPPQLDLLTGDEDFVTFSIGGNDAGFWGTVLTCFRNPDPDATPCRDTYLTDSGRNLLEERNDKAAARVDALVPQIKARAPHARVFMVGYQQVVPSDGLGCSGMIDASVPDLKFFDHWERDLNESLAAVAAKHGIRFVDVYAPSVGRNACQTPDVRWIEPMIGHLPMIKLHPNAAGEKAMASQVLAAWAEAEAEPVEPTGATGPSGPGGASGSTGTSGSTGVSGQSGATGSTGQSGSAGSVTPPGPPASAPAADVPRIVAVEVKPARLRATPRARLRVRLELTAPGSVQIALVRLRPGKLVGGQCREVDASERVSPAARCARRTAVRGRREVTVAAGRTVVRMPLRSGERPVPPGKYEVTVRLQGSQHGRATQFRVLKPRVSRAR